ncbi:MAG: dTDP-4-dehydrorhamnose 3,5-epimerase family protein [Patescibacteria group bacterium]|jgi:dTDP-4-dehydrorhamnose 3,5-epimerase
MIEGVIVKKLKVIPDDRGFLMEMLRSDDEVFDKFGQIYMTGVKRGVAKGWHYHKIQTDHFICVGGKALVVLYDARENSKTKGEVQEFILSEPETAGSQILLKIPVGVFHGFTATDCEEARIINIPTEKYNYEKPDEYRVAWNSPEVPYVWPKEVATGG